MTAISDFLIGQAQQFDHFPAVQDMVVDTPGSFLTLRVQDGDAVDVLPAHVALALADDDTPLIVFNFDGDVVHAPYGEGGLPSALPAQRTDVVGFGLDEDDELVERDLRVEVRPGGVVGFYLDGQTFFTAQPLYESAMADGVHLGYLSTDFDPDTYDVGYFAASDPGITTAPAHPLTRSVARHGSWELTAALMDSPTGPTARLTLTFPFDGVALAARRVARHGEL